MNNLSVFFAKRIDPPKPASFYTYYEIKEAGNTYLDTVKTLKVFYPPEKMQMVLRQ